MSCLNCETVFDKTNKAGLRNLCKSCDSVRTSVINKNKKNSLLCSLCKDKKFPEYCDACKESTSKICKSCGDKRTINLYKSISHTTCKLCKK